MYSDLMLCTSLDTFRIMAYSALFFYVYTWLFSHNQCYWGIFMHIETLLRCIQAYSGIFSTLCNPHITIAYYLSMYYDPSIFRNGGVFNTLWNVDQAYSKPCHRVLFSHIQACSEPCATRAYGETWHTCNPGMFRTLP